MDIETFRNYCLKKKGVTEELPFGPDTLVFKVMGKIFALAGLDEFPLRINLKCDPERALELRDIYPGIVLPGYHMNKRHWNTLVIDGHLSRVMLTNLIDHSYDLVVNSLTKIKKQELENL